MIITFAEANLMAMDVYADERKRLDAPLLNILVAAITSPLPTEATTGLVEIVYAHSDKFLKSSREKVAQVTDFLSNPSVDTSGLSRTGRGTKIAACLRGETVDEVPEFKPQFVFEKPEASEPPMPTTGPEPEPKA